MTSDYFNGYQSFLTSESLPSPVSTPDLSRSQRPSRSGTPSGRSSRPSPPSPLDSPERRQRSQDGRTSPLDPKRFTPNLHASLVSEILALRREIESKHHYVDRLELDLESSKSENASLADRLAESTKETRNARKRVDDMERQTSDAIEDIIKEKDNALVANNDLTNRLEGLLKRARLQEVTVTETQSHWQKDKQDWENERRQLERRLHVTETRLRMLAEELGARSAAADRRDEDEESGTFKDSGLGNESDGGSMRSFKSARPHRRGSSVSLRSDTHSLSSPARRRKPGKPKGFSLADELGLEEEDDLDMDDFLHRDTDDMLLDGARLTKLEFDSDAKAKKILGLDSKHVRNMPSSDSVTFTTSRLPVEISVARGAKHIRYNSEIVFPVHTGPVRSEPDSGVVYVHNKVQTSQPTTSEGASRGGDIVPEHRHPGHTRAIYSQQMQSNRCTAPAMTSVSTQTHYSMSDQESVPVTAAAKEPSAPTASYVEKSTQTERQQARQDTDNVPVKPPVAYQTIFVPSIAIHPPRSEPPSPRNALLPPGTRTVSCQTDLQAQAPTSNASVQTEEIRVDMRRLNLPRRLPSHGRNDRRFEETKPIAPESMDPSLPSPSSDIDVHSFDIPRSRFSADLRSLPLKALPLPRPVLASTAHQIDSGQHRSSYENGPLNRVQQYGAQNFSQPSKFLEGLHDDSDPESDHAQDQHDFGDSNDFFGTTSAYVRPAPQVSHTLPVMVPEHEELASPTDFPSPTYPAYANSMHRNGGYQQQTSDHVPLRTASKNWRDKAMHPRGAYTQFRSRTPSVDTLESSTFSVRSVQPPFPIPRRSSSRVPGGPPSEGPPSPSPRDGGSLRSRRDDRVVPPMRTTGLRKVQSASTMRPQVRMSPKRRRRQPSLAPIQSVVIEKSASTRFPIPDVPEARRDSITAPLEQESELSADLFTGIDATEDGQDSTLIDAIASTMVGEWMWKYVQKRRPFGVGDSSKDFAEDGSAVNNVVRHKRWVWLSPYERNIMWNPKQPATGAALLGKSGRKLIIKSVLDVRDTNPPPKGALSEDVFDRSIIVLTPSRALKFTATSRERHYLWLMALSFLANPSQGPPQVPRLPDAQLDGSRDEQSKAEPSKNTLIDRAKGRNITAPPKLSRGQSQPVRSPLCDQSLESVPLDKSDSLRPEATGHSRKRSNTGPVKPASFAGLHSLSSTIITPISPSRFTLSSASGSFFRPLTTTSSNKTSRQTTLSAQSQDTTQDASGTMRMEAFVDPNYQDGVLYVPAPPLATRRAGRRRGDSQPSSAGSQSGYVRDESGRDPFKGF